MSQTERIYQIVHLLENSRHPVPIARFLQELEISRATFKRDIEYLRDRLGAPISWQRGGPGQPRGYVLEGEHESSRSGFGKCVGEEAEGRPLTLAPHLPRCARLSSPRKRGEGTRWGDQR